MTRTDAIKAMHDRCAVYTATETAARLLDIVGWTTEQDLSSAVLLEPCAGEGAILVEAVDRLIASFRRHGHSLAKRSLLPRITAFEFHRPAAAEARRAVRLALMRANVRWDTASALADAWIRNADFLLQPPGMATHVAANPPYLRWSKMPASLAEEYRQNLRPIATRGDVALAFLDRMLAWAGEEGRISALMSDRWMFAQYGEQFITEMKGRGWSLAVIDDQPANPFVRRVGVSSAIVRLDKERSDGSDRDGGRRSPRETLLRLVSRYGTIADAGCTVKVGPALGCGETFLVSDVEARGIEEELVRPYISRTHLDGGSIESTPLKVVVPYDRTGRPIDLSDWPRFARWADRHADVLKARSHVRGQPRWWRTIDAIGPRWDDAPKLLLAEMTNAPRTTIDRSGGIPAHSIYAIWSSEWPVEALQRVLDAGLLRLTAEAEAPRLKGSWFRFYKRFIVRTPLPRWSQLEPRHRKAFAGSDSKHFAAAFEELFEFAPLYQPIGT